MARRDLSAVAWVQGQVPGTGLQKDFVTEKVGNKAAHHMDYQRKWYRNTSIFHGQTSVFLSNCVRHQTK
jgi:hypothetical protein